MALGRLLNRFGKDIEQVDAQLPDNVGRTLVRRYRCTKGQYSYLLQMYFLGVITTLVTVAAVSPIFIVFFALMCIAYLQ